MKVGCWSYLEGTKATMSFPGPDKKLGDPRRSLSLETNTTNSWPSCHNIFFLSIELVGKVIRETPRGGSWVREVVEFYGVLNSVGQHRQQWYRWATGGDEAHVMAQ